MRKNKYEIYEVDSLEDVCDVIYSNTEYMLKQNRKLNKKINTLSFIFGFWVYTSVRTLTNEIEKLKIKCE